MVYSPSLEFVKGALAVIGLHALYSLYQLFQAPSIESIRARNTKPVDHAGDDDTVTVWGFNDIGTFHYWNRGMSDSSPYVSRVEAYLRLIKQPYVKARSIGLRENPRKKVPFANVKGCMVDDSEVIIKTIKSTFNVTIDDDLTEDQTTKGLLIRRLLTGSLYWVLLNDRFNTERGRQAFDEEMKLVCLPVVMRWLICAMVFRSQNANLEGFGIGKQNPTVVNATGKADVKALASVLGDNQYILGTKTPTSYDCDVYSFLTLVFFDDILLENQWVQEVKNECPKLVEYVVRMRDLLYPEIRTHN